MSERPDYKTSQKEMIRRFLDRISEIRFDIIEKKYEILKWECHVKAYMADLKDFTQGYLFRESIIEYDEVKGDVKIRVRNKYGYLIDMIEKYSKLINEIREKLLNQGFLVMVGSNYDDMIMMAIVVILVMFLNNDIGFISRPFFFDPANYLYFANFIEKYNERFERHFGKLLIVYCPFEREITKIDEYVQYIRSAINDLMLAIDLASYRVPKPLALVMIPSDLYNALLNVLSEDGDEKMRNKLEMHKLIV
jgi:hypothetical protein